MKKRTRKATAVVPQLPPEYRGSVLPALPLREEPAWIQLNSDTRHAAGIQPSTVRVELRDDTSQHFMYSDAEVHRMMMWDARTRDGVADRACKDILKAIEGKELTAQLCHSLRMRLRKMADAVSVLTRVSAAQIHQRERLRQRCKADPTEVCRLVAARIADGSTTTDAFIEVSEELGVASETVRNAYYKHRKTRPK